MIIHRPPFTIHHFASLGSTNDQLKAMVAAPEFTCVVADEQTAGRGRRARTWHSSPGDGLYMSILFLPRSDASSRLPLTGLLAAVAVAETLIERGVAGVDIKWPNDVLVNGRKISGVLAEAVSAGSESLRLILGVGVNLNHRSFPPELSESATSLSIETGERVVVEEFRDRWDYRNGSAATRRRRRRKNDHGRRSYQTSQRRRSSRPAFFRLIFFVRISNASGSERAPINTPIDGSPLATARVTDSDAHLRRSKNFSSSSTLNHTLASCTEVM